MKSIKYTIPGMGITDHLLSAPLNWRSPDDGQTIQLFVREVVNPAQAHKDLPLLVYLEGGPGGKSPRPSLTEGWISTVLETHRLILLDQRGTGRSSPLQTATISAFETSRDARDYLLNFRADSIVADLEFVRHQLFGGKKWQTLGQSFGGFITLTYLSQAPEGLSACYIAGGLTSIRPSATELYQHTYPRVLAKNRRYYERFPEDKEIVAAVADIIEQLEARLPDGDLLTVRRIQTLGIEFGMCYGLDRVHWLFDEAIVRESLSDTFLAKVMGMTSYDHNPLYAVLQESIYCSGEGRSGWAAETVLANYPEFGATRRPLNFTGEMMFPWMFEEIRSLRPYQAVAEELAAFVDYPLLYDPDRLTSNEVPVAAIAYYDDIFVDAEYSVETSEILANVDLWITNEYEHDGLRVDSHIVRRLFEMLDRNQGPLLS